MTARQQSFVQEMLIDMNGTQAAIRAGYSKRTAYSIANELLKKAQIQSAIAQARAERAVRTQITADDVLKRWVDIATADARELVEYRRCACRYCWGTHFQFQWRTEREFIEATVEALNKEQPAPSKVGGFGYSKKLQPNPECPECDGNGEGQLVVKDTRNLSGQAALLYAGTNIGKDGIKVNMEDRANALVNVAKHMGMLDPKLTLKGDKKNPLLLLLEQVQGSALKPTATPGDDDD